MKVAILSGKGGTGKTFIAVNLAFVNGLSTYLDCDVEEPNGYLFFNPTIIDVQDVNALIPSIDYALCDGCQKCVDFCQFNALAYVNNKVILFDKICHSCAGCKLVCPTNAITLVEKKVGEVQLGESGEVKVCTGILKVGEPIATTVIEEVLKYSQNTTFIDCPPGSSCSVMESIKDVDYCLLVAEPSVFGLHNLNMVYNLVKLFEKPCGVVVNKCVEKENLIDDFCSKNNIKVLARLKYDTQIAKLNSTGEIVSKVDSSYREVFEGLLNQVKGAVGK